MNRPTQHRLTFRLLVVLTAAIAILVPLILHNPHQNNCLNLSTDRFPNLDTTGAVLLAFIGICLLAIYGTSLARERDEFRRTVLIQSMLWSIGATFTVTTILGVLETFNKVPHLNVLWVCPMFTVFMGVSRLLVMLRYR
jgi:hypothetical protein